MLRRKAPLKRGKRKMKRSPLKKTNVKRQAKRRAAYRSYLASKAWKEYRKRVLERDGFRCTAEIAGVRCSTVQPLHVHHKTYSRFGKELLDDCITLCRRHHEEVEAQLRGYKR